MSYDELPELAADERIDEILSKVAMVRAVILNKNKSSFENIFYAMQVKELYEAATGKHYKVLDDEAGEYRFVDQDKDKELIK